MAGFLDKFRKDIIASVWNNKPDEPKVKDIDDKIALGVLLRAVAEADEEFLPEEEKKIREILISYSKIPDDGIVTVLASIKKAAEERIDLHRFTREVSQNLPYAIKMSIVENLFRVACVDKNLDNNEIEIIRKISGLFYIDHRDFIDAKIRIKKEFEIN